MVIAKLFYPVPAFPTTDKMIIKYGAPALRYGMYYEHVFIFLLDLFPFPSLFSFIFLVEPFSNGELGQRLG